MQGFNRYAYANNNPYKYTDPSGENPLAVVVAAGIGCAKSAACRTAVKEGVKKVGEAVSRSRAKRRAAREAQRQHGTPTSRPGKNQQGRPNEDGEPQPRHQIKEGPDGKPDGVVDGSKDTVDGHGPHVEAGDLKQPESVNKHGQPRLQNGKSKVDIELEDSK